MLLQMCLKARSCQPRTCCVGARIAADSTKLQMVVIEFSQCGGFGGEGGKGQGEAEGGWPCVRDGPRRGEESGSGRSVMGH